uniref:Uncharacterized protein n=1 Tax=Medicago truncatula TaxID=3880 RepID=A2Q1P4_MEDTR|nr:hypothetical protein MtrDRAFT_AC148971g27v2 [Medicago truncatula]
MREKAQKVKRTMLDAAGPHGKAAHDFKTLRCMKLLLYIHIYDGFAFYF